MRQASRCARFSSPPRAPCRDAVKRRYLERESWRTSTIAAIGLLLALIPIATLGYEGVEGAGRITALPRSIANALRFRKLSGRSLDDLAREGLAMKKNQGLTWAQVAMAGNAPMLTKAALVDGRLDTGVLPTGQVVGLVEELPTVSDIISSIMEEAEATLTRLEGKSE